MIQTRLVVVLAICVALCGVQGLAQTGEELNHDQVIAARHVSPDLEQLSKELSLARKAGDVNRAREIEAQLFTSLPSVPKSDIPDVVQGTIDAELGYVAAEPQWGNDVKVYTGGMYSHGKRQIALDVDTLGGIYLAMNVKYHDTLSYLRAYRSTNGGRNWTYVNGFISSNRAIQSFDMCVTDTAGGKWLLGFAFILKSDPSSNGGGTLYWGSMLSDGTNWRYTVIAGATSSTNFRNPSICTDGTYISPSLTYHYVATEYITPSTDISRGLAVTRTTNWGKNWQTPDTTLRGIQEGTPSLAIDWSTSPDSLVVAYTRYAAPNREIRVARCGFTIPGTWKVSYPDGAKDDYDPSLAIDPVRGNGMISYTRATGSPTYNDAMYLYSTDLFKTYTRDSIATSSSSEELTSMSYAPWDAGYYWRVAYRSSAGGDTIFYKAIQNKLSGFYSSPAHDVSQYRPSTLIAPVVGFDRDIGGTRYRGNVAYVGYGPEDVYFDAVDLALDVPYEDQLPGEYALHQNYPNPFNPNTTIAFHLGKSGSVRLTVFDVLGRVVATLTDGHKDAGTHTVTFDAAHLASGVYVYRLQAGDFVQTRTMLLLK